jgi:hypothetical protein
MFSIDHSNVPAVKPAEVVATQLTLDDVTRQNPWLDGVPLEAALNQVELILGAKSVLGAAFEKFTGKALPSVDFLFFKIPYMYFGGGTLQCAIRGPLGFMLSDPRLWPMGDYWTITQELRRLTGV